MPRTIKRRDAEAHVVGQEEENIKAAQEMADQELGEVLARSEPTEQPTTQEVDLKSREGITVVFPSMFEDVVAFHRKFGIHYDGPPRLLPPELDTFRRQRLAEEMMELARALEHTQHAEELDAYIDIIYIILGTCHLRGWNADEAWRRVHAANMAKELASPENPGKYGSKADIVKPPGWAAPVLNDLV